MALKLDGYRETDEATAFNKGVERTFYLPAPYGPKGAPAELKIRFLYSGMGNIAYQTARTDLEEKISEWDEDAKAEARTGLLYDMIVLEWSTNIQSGGKDLMATRDNFISLATERVDEIAEMMLRVLSEMTNRMNFVTKRREEEAKN